MAMVMEIIMIVLFVGFVGGLVYEFIYDRLFNSILA